MSIRARSDVVLPYKLARQSGGWRGEIALGAFERFSALVAGGDGKVAVDLSFRLDDEGRCRLRGSARTTVGIECGRCLLPQTRDLAVELDLCIVGTDVGARALEADLEPYVLDGEEALVVDLVEDDLILGLPHEVCEVPEACPNRPVLQYPETATDVDGPTERNNPFAALADLVGKRG